MIKYLGLFLTVSLGFCATPGTLMVQDDGTLASHTNLTGKFTGDGSGLSNLTFTVSGSVTSGMVLATNFVLTKPKWTDILVSGFAIGAAVNAPGAVAVSPGSSIQGFAYGHGDDISWAIQTPHKLAVTNSEFSNFYFEPHIHISTTSLASGTNATFWTQIQVATIGGVFTSTEYNLTNTYGFTTTNTHSVLSFGNITNNALNGRSSVIFRGFTERIASASNDIGNAQVVIVDSIDVHIPVQEFGYIGQNGD